MAGSGDAGGVSREEIQAEVKVEAAKEGQEDKMKTTAASPAQAGGWMADSAACGLICAR